MRLQVFVVQDDLNKTKQNSVQKSLLNPEVWPCKLWQKCPAVQSGRWRGTAGQRSHLAGFGQEIYRVFRFQKSCDCETVEECQITIRVTLCLEHKSIHSSNVHFQETSEWESCNFQPFWCPWCYSAAFLKLLSIKYVYLWFLDRDQLSHCFGLDVHLLESMLRVKELTVYFVRSEETW